jgi:hypothetical protein
MSANADASVRRTFARWLHEQVNTALIRIDVASSHERRPKAARLDPCPGSSAHCIARCEEWSSETCVIVIISFEIGRCSSVDLIVFELTSELLGQPFEINRLDAARDIRIGGRF